MVVLHTKVYIDKPEDYEDDIDYYASFSQVSTETSKLPCDLSFKFNYNMPDKTTPYVVIREDWKDEKIKAIMNIPDGTLYSGSLDPELHQNIIKLIQKNQKVILDHFYSGGGDLNNEVTFRSKVKKIQL